MIQGYTVSNQDGEQVGLCFAHTVKEAEAHAARWGVIEAYVKLQASEKAEKDGAK
jgi:hypothetical protein